MSDHKPAFFASDHLPAWRATLLRAWAWLRLCFRNYPGYAIAAVAGSLGLVLALLLLFQGGLVGLVDQDTTPLVSDADDQPADLGDEEPYGVLGAIDRTRRSDDDDDVGISSLRLAKSAAASREPDDDPFVDPPSVQASPYRRRQAPADQAPPRRSNGLSSNSEPEIATSFERLNVAAGVDESGPDAEEAGDDAPLVADLQVEGSVEETVTNEPATAPVSDLSRRKPQPRVFIPEEDTSWNDDDDEVAEKDEPPPTRRPSSDVADIADRPLTSDDEPPVAETHRQPAWQNSTTKAAPARPSPPLPLAEHSDEVQTTIHVSPSEPERSEIEPAAASVPQVASPLKLQVNAPSQIVAGQNVELEFLVINMGRSPARDVRLSVYLPPGLSHTLGPELERPIALIAANELKRVRLTVKATASGPFKLQADLATGARVGAKLSATIGSGRVASSASRVTVDCQCAPLR